MDSINSIRLLDPCRLFKEDIVVLERWCPRPSLPSKVWLNTLPLLEDGCCVVTFVVVSMLVDRWKPGRKIKHAACIDALMQCSQVFSPFLSVRRWIQLAFLFFIVVKSRRGRLLTRYLPASSRWLLGSPAQVSPLKLFQRVRQVLNLFPFPRLLLLLQNDSLLDSLTGVKIDDALEQLIFSPSIVLLWFLKPQEFVKLLKVALYIAFDLFNFICCIGTSHIRCISLTQSRQIPIRQNYFLILIVIFIEVFIYLWLLGITC